MFDQALGLFNDHLSNRDVARGLLVERRGYDLSADVASHVGDFLRSLIHQQYHELDLGMVGGD